MSRPKVLIIDDEPSFADMLADYLRGAGFQARTADNLEDAIAIFRKERPRVVILDFNMPLVQGDRLLPILQSVDPLVRVIVISGLIREEVEEKFKGSGYFAFFEKGSLSLEALKQKIQEAMAP